MARSTRFRQLLREQEDDFVPAEQEYFFLTYHARERLRERSIPQRSVLEDPRVHAVFDESGGVLITAYYAGLDAPSNISRNLEVPPDLEPFVKQAWSKVQQKECSMSSVKGCVSIRGKPASVNKAYHAFYNHLWWLGGYDLKTGKLEPSLAKSRQDFKSKDQVKMEVQRSTRGAQPKASRKNQSSSHLEIESGDCQLIGTPELKTHKKRALECNVRAPENARVQENQCAESRKTGAQQTVGAQQLKQANNKAGVKTGLQQSNRTQEKKITRKEESKLNIETPGLLGHILQIQPKKTSQKARERTREKSVALCSLAET